MLPSKYGVYGQKACLLLIWLGRSDKAEQMLFLSLLEWNNSKEIWKKSTGILRVFREMLLKFIFYSACDLEITSQIIK